MQNELLLNMKNKRIALVGQPNCGKSTLFNVLSDINTDTSNFAGTTNIINQSDINIFGETVTIVDLPGTYSLNPNDLSESITVKYLLEEDVDLIVNVVNSALLTRSIELTIELMELGLPMIIVLNMQDEADKQGLIIDKNKLSEITNLPVVFTTARFGKGVKNLVKQCSSLLKSNSNLPKKLDYTYHLEVRANELADAIEKLDMQIKGNPRFYALKTIESPDIIPKEIVAKTKILKERIEKEIKAQHNVDGYESISYERHHLAMKISEEITKFGKRKSRLISEKLDDYLLHPIGGYFFLMLYFAVFFGTVFFVGNFLTGLLDVPINSLAEIFEPLKSNQPFLWHTINGAFMGFVGIVGIVLPYFLPLIFLTAYSEDTGYLSRVAFLLDGIMHKIGLHGKSIIPFIMGFGCAVPALYATRMIESRRDRTITAVLLLFVPCTARIAVIFALTAAFAGPIWAFVVFAFVAIIIALNGKILSKLISKPLGLIMEIPRLAIPSLKVSFKKTWFKSRNFFKDAFIYLIGGSIVLDWIEYFHVAHYVDRLFSPVVHFILGLPEALGSTLIFGFFRKELIIVMANQALGVKTLADMPLTAHQVMVFIIFVTLYFPCFTTLIVLWKEFNGKTAVLASIFTMVVATISAFVFRMIFYLF